ncbi:MAG: putative L,D-transpeptidase YkuD [Pelotomaculum sp. PtaB.Bin104]|nr:MAG: putative L,D-transpeptidase YkuD [Pelotomaculum sp. PtaB.Bin104]
MLDIRMRSYGSYIAINLNTRRLTFYEGERLTSTYPVGVGKSSTPTPVGDFTVVVKIISPGGALGTRWMGLSIPNGNYGIHGTNNPSSIGGYVSNGCIRMYNQDVEKLFPKVHIGTPVKIRPGAADNQSGSNLTQKQAGVHIVQSGETLWQIASRYGKTLDQLLSVNNISNPDVIFPGQTIVIPK